MLTMLKYFSPGGPMKLSFVFLVAASQIYVSSLLGLTNSKKFDWADHPEILRVSVGEKTCFGALVGPRMVLFPDPCTPMEDKVTVLFSDASTGGVEGRYVRIASKESALYLMTLRHDAPSKARPAIIGGRPIVGQRVTLFASSSTPGSEEPFGYAEATVASQSRLRLQFTTKGESTVSAADNGGLVFNRSNELLGLIVRADRLEKSEVIRLDVDAAVKKLEVLSIARETPICGVTDECR